MMFRANGIKESSTSSIFFNNYVLSIERPRAEIVASVNRPFLKVVACSFKNQILL